MDVQIDNKGFILGDHRFVYNLYFLEHGSEFAAPTSAGTFKKILVKWAEALQRISKESSPMFLPFGPDDQWTDCLKATLIGDKIVFAFVRLAENGWGVFDFDLADFITSPHEIDDESSEFGEYSKEELVSALLNAEVIDDSTPTESTS